nr:hypothetical protein BDOA9_0148380 [Bradyrhizobium sp. DOA9]
MSMRRSHCRLTRPRIWICTRRGPARRSSISGGTSKRHRKPSWPGDPCRPVSVDLSPRTIESDGPTSGCSEQPNHHFGFWYASLKHMSDRVAVVYLGRVVGSGHWRDIFERPAHPYTQA